MRLFAEPKLGSMAIGEAAGLIDLGSARTDIGGCFRIGSTERAGLGRGTEILAVRRIAAVLLAFMLPLTGCSEPASDALQAAGVMVARSAARHFTIVVILWGCSGSSTRALCQCASLGCGG